MGNEQDKRTRKVCESESESDAKLTSRSLATLKVSSAIVSTLYPSFGSRKRALRRVTSEAVSVACSYSDVKWARSFLAESKGIADTMLAEAARTRAAKLLKCMAWSSRTKTGG
jgi:hypothetical protein